MKLVIIESPYAGGITENVEYARKIMHDSLLRGEAPLLSHLLYTQCLNDSNINERCMGINAGIAWYAKAELCAVYTDKGISEGMKIGIVEATDHGVPIEYRSLYEKTT